MIKDTDKFVNGSATFRCNSGFQLVGQETINCTLKTTWTSPAPTCKGETKAILRATDDNQFRQCISQ